MRLVVKSKLPAAEKFESWVFDEVLPTIRKTGKYETPNKKIDLLSPKFIAAMRKVRTVQLATGMTKVQSSKFAREVIKREFGADMVHEVIGDYLQQLDLV
jgi:prophage antirepressor-like protein